MAKNILQVNYDELNDIAKKFKDEGEDALKLHSATRQRVQDLHKEWIGEAAEKFFDEMEGELLPALQRLSRALHFSQDMVSDIMKIVYEADEDTANFFKGDFSGDDFGAGAFRGALGGLVGGQGALDDFGASKFDGALGGFSTGDIPGGGSASADDFGAGKFDEALPSQGGGETGGGQTDSSESGGSDNQTEEETTETDIPAGGGGGGSSSPSQGLQGDLKGMGVGMGQVLQNASAGGPTVGGEMTDHVYSGGDPSEAVSGESQTPSGSSTKSSDLSSGGGGSAAAGAAGAAAAGGAAKGIKGRKKKNK